MPDGIYKKICKLKVYLFTYHSGQNKKNTCSSNLLGSEALPQAAVGGWIGITSMQSNLIPKGKMQFHFCGFILRMQSQGWKKSCVCKDAHCNPFIGTKDGKIMFSVVTSWCSFTVGSWQLFEGMRQLWILDTKQSLRYFLGGKKQRVGNVYKCLLWQGQPLWEVSSYIFCVRQIPGWW